MQRYLKASDVTINQEEVQTICKMRSRMILEENMIVLIVNYAMKKMKIKNT